MPSVVFENRSTWPQGEMEIYIDGEHVGKVQRHDTFEIIVDPGVHSFKVRADHGIYSLPIAVRLEKRESVGFLCATSGVFEKRVDFALVFHHKPHDRFDEHDLVKLLAAEAVATVAARREDSKE